MTIVNVEQAAAWDGDEGAHWARHADHYENAALRQWQHVVGAGVIGEADSVLDIGCGTGKSTREAARVASAGQVLGVDLSSRMLDEARARAAAEGLANVRFEQADAQVHPFEEGAYDIAMSEYGAMFFNDLTAAFTNIGRALKPGGRLALMVWRELHRNEWVREIRNTLAAGRTLPDPPPEAPTPFSLADPDRVRRILSDAGFTDIALEPVDEPIQLGSDAEDAYAVFSTTGIVAGLTEGLDASTRDAALVELRQLFRAHDRGDGVLFDSASWLVTAVRS